MSELAGKDHNLEEPEKVKSMEQVVAECLNGQKESFNEIVKIYHNKVLVFVASRVDLYAIEDIVQETFLRAYRSLAKCRQPDRFSSWLFGIARNCMHEWTRKNRKVEGHLFQDVAASSHTESKRKIKLAQLITSLTNEMKQVVIMKYQGNMTCEEIAVAMDRPIGTIRSWLVRAHAKLRVELANFFEEENEV